MDISEKKTVLDDSASIYQKREEKSDRAKWKELKGFKAKWDHFKAYYLLKCFIGVCAVAFVGYMLYEAFGPEKERVLYVAMLDNVVLTGEMEVLQAGYEEYVALDEENQETLFDNMMMVSDSTDVGSTQKFTALAFAGDIDVVIAKESLLQEYAGYYFRPLSDQLPADLYEELTELFCYARPVDDDGNFGEEQPYGIYVSDLMEQSPACKEPIVLGICGNTERQADAEEFVRYLLKRSGWNKNTEEN